MTTEIEPTDPDYPDFYLVVGTNTYADDEAANYFATRLHSSAWTNASDTDRQNALRQATAMIDTLDFYGRRAAAGQALAWPRTFVRDRDGYHIDPSTVPRDIIAATCEWSLHLLANDPSKPQSFTTVKQVGDLHLEFSPMLPDTLPPLVRRYLQPYLRTSSANTAAIIP